MIFTGLAGYRLGERGGSPRAERKIGMRRIQVFSR